MQPEIGPIKTFGVMFALGFLASGAIIARRLREQERPVDWAYEIVFSALVGGVVGARLWYIVQHSTQLTNDPLGTLFSGSGLVWYGGALGGAAAVILWAWRRGMLEVGLLDICSVPLAVGYAIGRIGCQLSGDGDYGKPTDLPWGMAYPHGTVPTDVKVHPTPVYETLAMGLVAWMLWTLRDRVRPGVLFAIYLVAAGIERFLVEFIRRNTPDVAGLTVAQVFSVGMVAVGVAWIGIVRSRHGTLAHPGAGRVGRPAPHAA